MEAESSPDISLVTLGGIETATPTRTGATISSARAWFLLATLIVGYIGIYICRKNFPVAIPLIRAEFGVSKARIGEIASASTLAYMIGKFTFGPLIDRFGGRAGFLLALFGVAIFAGAGAFTGSFTSLMIIYSLNRFAGAAGWGSMVKLLPDWFPVRSLPLAMAFLSLSFVFGGVCATMLAGWIAQVSHNDWRWVMGGPALLLLAILGFCWAVLPVPGAAAPVPRNRNIAATGLRLVQVREVLVLRQFWVICALSLTLTLLRETFNTWTVDFFQTEGGTAVSSRMAAFLSTPFDALGAVGIVVLGWVISRVAPRTRNQLLFLILTLLGMIIFILPGLAKQNLLMATVAIGAVGFLAYGPYSLLAGILSLEIRGQQYVATVAGMVDGSGYLAGILAGQAFGHILDVGGYALAFPCLALLALVSGVLCLFLSSHPPAIKPSLT